MHRITRRTVIAQLAAGALGRTLVCTLGGFAHCSSSPRAFAEDFAVSRLPREVWVGTVCQHGLQADTSEEMLDLMLDRMEHMIPQRPDIICLPEMFHVAYVRGPRKPISETSEVPIGRFSQPFAEFAKQHRCYVVCPISTVENGRYYNSAVVIDRDGRLVGEYRKINPTVNELDKGIAPGPVDPPVFELDFGKIGIQICYDINWHENWRRLSEKGAEIVFWPSAFAGGRMLNALAWINKYYIVSSTRIQASKIVDVLGDEIATTGRFATWICQPINLDVAVVQTHRNIAKLDEVAKKYGRAINIKVQHVEAWARLESRSSEVTVTDVLKEFGLETARQMFARETKLQDAARAK
ncbi:MAG: carbon-nitrogen hydrolase family protein [Planctomycetota bacterium]|nr:MAG: carbon-nitrogen hydrolase family protein [Planctomycetota bacterium]